MTTISRRDLLKSAGLAAGALTGSALLPHAPRCEASDVPAPQTVQQAGLSQTSPLQNNTPQPSSPQPGSPHHDDDIVAKTINSDRAHIPTLFARLHSRHIAFVSTVFPNVPGLRLDACTYEPGDGFLPLELLGIAIPRDNQLILTHRVAKQSGLVHVTTLNAQAGAIEAIGQLHAVGNSRPSEPVLTPNMCWGFQKSPGFVAGGVAGPPYGESPTLYPNWIDRCFVFTEQGRTFLDKTERVKTDEVPPNDPRNNPVWSQHYIGTWQKIGGRDPVPQNTSRTRYVLPVIGAVSNDGKSLIALASDSPRYLAQAWHTCLHHVVSWLPANAPPLERKWRIKMYAMENDPVTLITRVSHDFPAAMKLRDHAVAIQ